jgi:hypothetical protein
LEQREFFRYLTLVFATPDTIAHGLAVRTLWVSLVTTFNATSAAEQFTSLTSHHCAGARFSSHVRNSLFAVLLGETHELARDVSHLHLYLRFSLFT